MPSRRPLAGRTLLAPDGLRVTPELRGLGAEVVEVELIRRVETADPGLNAAIVDLAHGGYDWLAFTSPATPTLLGRVNLGGARVAAVGPASAAAARAAGFPVDLVPASGSGGKALAEAWPGGVGRVLLPGAARAASQLPRRLRDRGWQVDQLAMYRTEPISAVPDEVAAAWAGGDFDLFLVTAGSVAHAAKRLLGVPGPPVVAVGEQAAKAARAAGFLPVATTDVTRLAQCVQTVLQEETLQEET